MPKRLVTLTIKVEVTLVHERIDTYHNSPNHNECKTQSSWVLALPWKWAHLDNSNDTPKPMCECQVSIPLLRIRINQDKP